MDIYKIEFDKLRKLTEQLNNYYIIDKIKSNSVFCVDKESLNDAFDIMENTFIFYNNYKYEYIPKDALTIIFKIQKQLKIIRLVNILNKIKNNEYVPNNTDEEINILNYLYVDDIREPQMYMKGDNLFNIDIARTYNETIDKLNIGKYDIIDLDHDLGEEKTGYDICKYIIENKIPVRKIYIHTNNPVGRFNMYQLIKRYIDCDITIY